MDPNDLPGSWPTLLLVVGCVVGVDVVVRIAHVVTSFAVTIF
jgi:hypothetical protein